MSGPDSIDDLLSNPNKYGMPTLKEYMSTQDKRKWLGHKDELLESIDNGDPILGVRQRYYLEFGSGVYRVTSLDQAQRIAVDSGLNFPQDFVVDPQLRHDSSSKIYNHVTFRSKSDLAKRANW